MTDSKHLGNRGSSRSYARTPSRTYQQILVRLEGSRSTEAATLTAIQLARGLRASLVGLAIVDEPDIRAGAAVGIGVTFKRERDAVLMADAHKQASDWLVLFESRCRSAGVPAKALEVVGRPADSIIVEMASRDLTVMGRDANFKFETDSGGLRDARRHPAPGQRANVLEGRLHRLAQSRRSDFTASGTKGAASFGASGGARRG